MPSVQFNCLYCKLGLSVPEHRAGTDVRCPGCKKAVKVPASSQRLKAPPPPPHPPRIDVPNDPVPVLEPVLQSPEIEAKPMSGASAGMVKAPAESPEPDLPGANPAGANPADQSTQQRLDDLVKRHRISLSRSVIYTQGGLLVGVGLAGLFLGLLIGWGTSDDSLIQETQKSATVIGRVTYADGRFNTADPGAVVMVLPRGSYPSDKIPTESLKPGDAPISPDDPDPIVMEIRQMGGDVARTGPNGQFRLRVPSGGSFYLLAISNNRPRNGVIKTKDLGEISHYFKDTSALIGEQSYRWTRELLKAKQTIGILFP